jgi:hypothetical protein
LGDLDINTDVTDALKVIYYEPTDNQRKANSPDPNAKYKSMASRHAKLARQRWFRWLMKREWGRRLLFVFFGKKKDTPKGWPTHFPFIHKTDEERCENLPQMLGYDKPLIVTEKLDGTSTTFILERKGKKKFEFYVLSRNVRQRDEKQECYHDHNIYWDMAFKYDVENKLRQYLEDHPNLTYVCVQGESVGSVQGNPLKLDEDDFYAFNFIDSINGRWASDIASVEVKNKLGVLELKNFITAQKAKNTYVCEFHSVELFLGVLISINADIKIISPDWLRSRAVESAQRIINNNK